MKIVLERLKIENFKGISKLEIEFDKKRTIITGANGTGKSSVYDAYCWLLFDKDRKNRSDFDVKPLDGTGEVKNRAAVTTVSADILFGDRGLNLKRTYFEKWTRKRGNAEATYDGNTSEYFIDDIPIQKNEYREKINELCPESRFRLLSDLAYFNEVLNWQDRRGILLEIADTGAADELLNAAEYDDLREAMNGHTVEDCKKALLSRRKTENEALKTIPARIEECRTVIRASEGINFENLRAEREQLAERVKVLKTEALACDAVKKETELKKRIESVENEIKSLNDQNEDFRKLQRDHFDGDREKGLAEIVGTYQREIDQLDSAVRRENDAIRLGGTELEDLRKEYISRKNEKFKGLEPCPTCGRPFGEDEIEKARQVFELNKRADLVRLEDMAAMNKAVLAEHEAEGKKLRAELSAAEQNRDAKQAELDQIRKDGAAVEIRDMPHFSERMTALNAERDRISAELKDAAKIAEIEIAEKSKLCREIEADIDALTKKIALEDMNAQLSSRIAELKASSSDATQRINEIDRLIALADEYTMRRAALIEDATNGMFAFTRFKMFDKLVNGGLIDCCEAMYNGVAYNGTLNEGHRVLVALDIINALSTAYGIRVPLFIDNAERISWEVSTETQLIMLEVSNAPTLIFNKAEEKRK